MNGERLVFNQVVNDILQCITAKIDFNSIFIELNLEYLIHMKFLKIKVKNLSLVIVITIPQIFSEFQ